VYSYGLSLAKGFTFAMTLIGLRVRDWKRVIGQGTNNSLDMVEDVLWLEKKLKLRKAEERWGLDQALVTRGLLRTNLCPLPPTSSLWDNLALSPWTSSPPQSSPLPCYQGNTRTCDRSTKKSTSQDCLWWHFLPDQGVAEVQKKYFKILHSLNHSHKHPN